MRRDVLYLPKYNSRGHCLHVADSNLFFSLWDHSERQVHSTIEVLSHVTLHECTVRRELVCLYRCSKFPLPSSLPLSLCELFLHCGVFLPKVPGTARHLTYCAGTKLNWSTGDNTLKLHTERHADISSSVTIGIEYH